MKGRKFKENEETVANNALYRQLLPKNEFGLSQKN